MKIVVVLVGDNTNKGGIDGTFSLDFVIEEVSMITVQIAHEGYEPFDTMISVTPSQTNPLSYSRK